jgi:hypothetical protein
MVVLLRLLAAPNWRTVQGRDVAAVPSSRWFARRQSQLEAAHLEAVVTVDVDSVLSPEGDFKVALTVDQGSRWFKPKPVHLSRYGARHLAYRLLEAAGFHYAAVLDEELDQLQAAADSTTSVEDYERLVMLRSMVQVMRKMFPKAAQ